MSTHAPAPAPRPDLRARVLAAAANEPSPTRGRVLYTTAVLLAGGVAAAAAAFVSLGGMHAKGRPAELVVATALGWGVVAAVGTAIAFVRGRKGPLGRTRATLAVVALLSGPLLMAWAALWTARFPEAREPAGTLGIHLRCFATTLLFAGGPFVALGIARRGTDPVHPRTAGAALGAAAGAWGGVMIDLHCEISAELHVALAHVLPVAVLALAGALLGGRILGVRSS